MTTMKKLFALMLAVLMLLSVCAVAGAEETKYTITINNEKEGHTYEAYQIFSGDVSGESPNYVLSNIKLGNGVAADFLPITIDGTEYKTLDELTKVLNTSNVDAFAKAASGKLGTSAATSTFADDKYTITLSNPGYYFVKETTANMPNGEAYTKFMVQVVGEVSLVPKTATTTHEKKVKENVKYSQEDVSTNGYQYGMGYNDVADYCIGDDVPFSLYSQVPDLEHYDRYLMVFHDKMDEGLTFNSDSVEVKVGNETLEVDKDYSVNSQCEDGCNFEIKIFDLKDYSEQEVRVDFTAKLNEKAKIGLPGNLNQSQLEFSNNPNNTGSVEGNDDGDTTVTPWDEVVVFTYELDITKVDGSETAKTLSGAKFLLQNADGKYATVHESSNKVNGWVAAANVEAAENVAAIFVSDDNGKIQIAGLDDGTYQLIEVEAPTGYNKLANPITIDISANTVNGHDYSSAESAPSALANLKITVGEGDSAKTEDGDHTTGTVSTTVENNMGATLPTTGGIGTTIFYVAGGVLVLLAVVLLVTKRRVGENN